MKRRTKNKVVKICKLLHQAGELFGDVKNELEKEKEFDINFNDFNIASRIESVYNLVNMLGVEIKTQEKRIKRYEK